MITARDHYPFARRCLPLLCLILPGLLTQVPTAGAGQAARKTPVAHATPPKKNRAVARLAGLALHLSQDAQSLARAEVKRREKLYGRADPQARAGRRRLRRIHGKMRYFRRVKRRSEGR